MPDWTRTFNSFSKSILSLIMALKIGLRQNLSASDYSVSHEMLMFKLRMIPGWMRSSRPVWFEPSWRLKTTKSLSFPTQKGQERRMKGKTEWIKIRKVYLNNRKREKTIVIIITEQAIYNELLTPKHLTTTSQAVWNSCPSLGWFCLAILVQKATLS